jgi:AraC-like DNA-binding protein
MPKDIHREITPLQENDCFLVFDRKRNVFDFPIHFHPEYEINFISNAKGAKRIAGDHIGEAGEKELVMCGPNLYHGWENHNYDTSKTLHEITIQFPRELFCHALLNRNVLKPIKELFDNSQQGILFSKETIQIIEPQLRRLRKKRGFDSFLEFQSLLYNLAISRNQQFLSNTAFLRQSDFHNSERIEKVYNYIKENYAQKLRVEDAAKLVNMSVVSFSRLIKQRTGRSFVDFVNEIRLGMATRSLIETTKGVTEICYECGFNNVSNFNRIFKKKQNCTPSEFRENFNGTRNVN